MWGSEPSHSQGNSHLGDGVPVDSQNFRERLQGSKFNGSWRSLYHWKALEAYMSKMGSLSSFEHLKHKLWPKEGPGVELSVWLPTTKSRESTSSRCPIRECDMALESSRRELQLCFRPHRDPRSARKVMGLQSPESPIWRDFESPGKNNHLDVASVASHRVYYKGEGGGFHQVRAVVSLVCPCCPWFVLAPRVLQLCTNHFVWVVCRPVWVTKVCQLFLVPSRSSNMPLYPSKCCELGSMLRLLLFHCFLLGLTFEPFKELRVRQKSNSIIF